MAIILNAREMRAYTDDEYHLNPPTVRGNCSSCGYIIEVGMRESECPECGVEFNLAPKEMLTAKYLCV